MGIGLKPSRREFLGATGLGAAAIGATAGAVVGQPAPLPSRSEFMLAPGLTHFNTASLGPTARAVFDRTIAAWRQLESSPVSMAYVGAGPVNPRKVVNQADEVRGKAGALLGCDADEVLITHGTTDGMNTVAQGVALTTGDRILTTDQEHEGGSYCWDYRARRDGAAIDRVAIPLDEGDLDAIVGRFERAITPATRVISVSHVISTTGLRMPIAKIVALARARGILTIVDGAQAAGNIPVDVKALGCDAYATSGHKWLMGPKGTGLLYVSREADTRIQPIQWTHGRLYGSEATGVGAMTLAVGLGSALDAVLGWGLAAIERHNLALRAQLHAGLGQVDGLRLVGPPPGPNASAMIACALPDSLDSRAVARAMLDRGIIVKMAEKRWLNGLRISPHVFNTPAEVERAVRALRAVLAAA